MNGTINGMAGFMVVAAGGALGACARYSVSLWFADHSTRFPFATLAANLLGALLAGFIVTFLFLRTPSADSLATASSAYLLLVTGFLGSFTTLSAFSIETLRLVQAGAILSAISYVLLTISGALMAAFIGGVIARTL